MPKDFYSESEINEIMKNAYKNDFAGFPIHINDCALLVIDMQDEFVRPNWTPYWVPEATKQAPLINDLIVFCHENNILVIFTAFSDTYHCLDRPKSGCFMPNRYKDKITDPNPEWFTNSKIYHQLTVAKNDLIIYKPSYGAFYDTPLETILKNLEKKTVIICGTLTNFCCSTTARQAYERGFQVVFGSDINSAEDPLLHESELKVLRKGFARVLTVEQIKKLLLNS